MGLPAGLLAPPLKLPTPSPQALPNLPRSALHPAYGLYLSLIQPGMPQRLLKGWGVGMVALQGQTSSPGFCP